MKFKNNNKKLFSIPILGIVGLLIAFKPDSTSSIIGGFYADSYGVDLVMLAIAIAFIAIMIILKLREAPKS